MVGRCGLEPHTSALRRPHRCAPRGREWTVRPGVIGPGTAPQESSFSAVAQAFGDAIDSASSMATAPYTPQPNNLPKFLTHIRSAGVPQKVTQTYLESVGFKTKNDRYIIAVLKAIDFLDANGVPTNRWKAYRDTAKGPGVLAAAIVHGYSGLFQTYPDAYRRDNEALRNYFSTHFSNLGESTLNLVVRTFKALADAADFENPAAEDAAKGSITAKPERAPATPAIPRAEVAQGLTTININIQLQLPVTDDASVYEKLFEALHKSILARGHGSS
jgi:Family of unknown function (DUF5343)